MKPGDERAAVARCSRCDSAFSCGMLAGVQSCWCARLPPIAPVPGRGCLCPACLEEELRQSKNVAS